MHLLIPFATSAALPLPALLKAGDLPQLAALLHDKPELDEGEDISFSMPHERAWASHLGWAGGDGGLPWAARAVAADGRDPGDLAWGQLTPVHLQLGADRVTLTNPDDLALDDGDARALFESVQALFVSEGFVLVYQSATCWTLAHESLRSLRTASPERVVGHNIDPWLPRGQEARLFRRLQNEVQMHWHEHPINQAREALGRLPVNSVWLSGCGVRQPEVPTPDLQIRFELQAPALASDGAAWRSAWMALDAGPVAALAARQRQGHPAALTLCGNRSSARWHLRARSVWQRMASRWRANDPSAVLEAL